MGPEALGSELELSYVTKITSVARKAVAKGNSVRPDGEYFVAKEPNSFGIPAVDTCPGKTECCEQDCYAIEAEQRTATHEKLQHNYEALLNADTAEGQTEVIRGLISKYSVQADKLGIPKLAASEIGEKETKRRFRIHWSGDFYSPEYAQAWRNVIEENPDIQFFVYTRSFQPDVNVVPILSGIDNLDLFLSVDKDNVDRAFEVLAENSDVRVAYLVDYYEDAEELRAKLGRTKDMGFREFACPENMRHATGARKLPVVSEKGGACSRCTYCIGKPDNWDVTFVKTGLEFLAEPMLDMDYPEPVIRKQRPTIEPVAVEIIANPKKTEQPVMTTGTLALIEVELSLFSGTTL